MADPAPTPVKPGTQTTEFYVTIATMVIGLLVHFGVIGQTTGDQWSKAIPGLMAALAPLVYIISRAIVKKAAAAAIPSAPPPAAPAPVPAPPQSSKSAS